MKPRAATLLVPSLFLLFVSLLAPAPAVAGKLTDEFFSELEGAKEENLFPEPLEESFRRIHTPEDRLIQSFRELSRSRLRQASGGYLEELVVESHEPYHQALCWSYTKELRRQRAAGNEGAWERLHAALGDLPHPADLAAFEPVLARLEGEEELHERSQARAAAIEDATALESYVSAVDADPEFYRRARAWTRLGRRVKKGWDAAVEKVSRRFLRENMIRFLERLDRNQKVGERTRRRVRESLAELRQELVPAVLEDLDDRLEGGLTQRMQTVSRVGDYVQTRSVLITGRLRVLVKFVQTLKGSRDLNLFLPPLREVHRGVKARLSRGDFDEQARAYLGEVDRCLDNLVMVLRLRARHSTPAPDEEDLWQSMWEALEAEGLDELGELGQLPTLD